MSERRDEPEPRGAELWLAPFVRDPTLWPVALVVAIIAIVFAASALLLALERNGFAAAAVALAFWVGIDAAWRHRRRSGSPLALTGVLGFWGLAAGAALGARQLGWF